MFTIGDFARHGRVSVRMLRHYDAIGLLRPAHTDESTGYRLYDAGQLARLNRIVALKDLGFTLQQVGSMLDEKVDLAELRGMLRLRQAELTEQIAADTARLANVESRLRSIESDGLLPADEVVLKPLPAVRVAELTGTAAGYYPEAITAVIRPLYGELYARLARAGVQPAGERLAYYEDAADGVTVHATVPVMAPVDGVAVVDLPAVERAATVLHRGPMDDVLPVVQGLARWVDENGYRSAGPPRELTIACPADDPAGWVTELQEPVVPVAGTAS
jgi:DNA-binding transcriptional MerR regulator